MDDAIWWAANRGDLTEVERLVGQDPGLLDAKDTALDQTPLMAASEKGHVRVVRWLLDKGAPTGWLGDGGSTALGLACFYGRFPVVKLLLERGANPIIAGQDGSTPLMDASSQGHLEIVRVLLGHPSASTIINDRDYRGRTALFEACYHGHGGIASALLQSGADPTIADRQGTTPVATAKQDPPPPPLSPLSTPITVEGRRECVAALEVRSRLPPYLSSPPQHLLWPACCVWHGGSKEGERAYQLWKARQVADQQGSGAVAVEGEEEGKEGEAKEALLDFAVHGLKGTCSRT
jgi:hypothetical protein